MFHRNIRAGCQDWITGSFVAGVGLMAISILFLRPVTAWLARHYDKQSAPIRCPLRQFDFSAIPSFRQGWKVSLNEAPVEDIGTSEYLYAVLTRQDKNTPDQPSLFVTYYNDPRDKVPHTPDVCWRQAGYVVKEMATIPIATPQLGPLQSSVSAVLMVLEGEKTDAVNLHLFLAEGRFFSSRNQVRWQLARPGNTHTYFSKVEVGVNIARGNDPTVAIELGKRLMAESLPVLLANHFPTAEQLRQHD